jgi:putative redox protein
MKKEVNINWVEGMEFLADLDGHKVTIDAGVENGGKDKGARPKPFMLLALAGCTGMDVVGILKKMRVEFDGLSIKVEGEINDELPKPFMSMHVVYKFKGQNLSMEKLEKAVELSREKYCGVSATLLPVIPITYEIVIE